MHWRKKGDKLLAGFPARWMVPVQEEKGISLITLACFFWLSCKALLQLVALLNRIAYFHRHSTGLLDQALREMQVSCGLFMKGTSAMELQEPDKASMLQAA